MLGDSGGALVGLELVSRYPEQVRMLVAHEPPLTRLLDDADEHAKFVREVYDSYRSEGAGPAMGKFAAGTGLDQDPPEMAEAMVRMQGNLDFFLGHMCCHWATTRPVSPGSGRGRSRWPWARLRRGNLPIAPLWRWPSG